MRWFFLILIFSPLIGSDTFSRDDNIDPGLMELIEKIDEKGSSIQTVRARFVQHKEISLLEEPVDMKGVFYLRKQDGIKFDFEPKEDLEIIITKEEMISLSHQAKKANRIKLKKRKTALTRGVLSEKLKSLLGYFTILRASNESGNHHLVLSPTKRKLKKRFQDLELWVNSDYLIHRIKVTSKDGDIYELSLTDIEINIDLPENLFNTQIPEDFELGDRMEYIFGSGISL